MTIAPAVPVLPRASASRRAGEPYVGLRPYREAERELFHGRDEDAIRLRNKIFAGQITVVYAPSGVGKTSLLRTLVVPDLRTQDALVVYFDEWHDDPLPLLRLAIQERAQAEGVALPAENMSLVRLAEAAVRDTGKPLVLILDQFEAFLIRHARRLDPLREELAALARSKVDAHVVLALREEFVAALDPFRDRIATLFRSTYRLLPLMGDGALKAIVRPVELFGGTYEEPLVQTLLEDLRVSSRFEGDPAAAHGGGIDLPFLQIVCLRLWRQAIGSGTRQLTLASYEQLGRCSGIIRGYVDQVVTAVPRRERSDMAKVLDYLAPRSGTKMSYAVQDLSERTGLPESRISTVLQHLNEHWVVRSRQSGDAKTYELYHDSFIKILRPWIDKELEGVTRRRLAAVSLAAGLGVGLVVMLTSGWKDRKAEQDRTRGVFERLATAQASARSSQSLVSLQAAVTEGVDGVARYLVGKGDPASLERLSMLLQRYERLVVPLYARPDTAGGDSSSPAAATGEAEQNTAPDASRGGAPGERPRDNSEVAPRSAHSLAEETRELATMMHHRGVPLALLYSPSGVPPDTAELRRSWSPLAEQLLDSLGLPAPRRLIAFPDSAVPADSFLLLSAQAAEPTLRVLPVLGDENSVVVRQDSLPVNVQKFFFDQPKAGWRRVPALLGGPWWVVPRWSLPIWRASGQPERSSGDLTALAVELGVLQEPDLLFTPEATRYLLRRAALADSVTVDNALAVRGEEEIRQTFIAIARGGRPLTTLSPILDLMVDYPEQTPEQIAARISMDPRVQLGGTARVATRRADARTSGTRGLHLAETSIQVYPPLEAIFPERPVRVYLGDTLVHRLAFETRGELRPEILSAISELRVELLRQLGIEVPGIWFRADTALPPEGFRLELLTQTRSDSGVRPRIAPADSALPAVMAALRPALIATRLHWVNSGIVQQLVDALPRNQRGWIQGRFTNQELKLVLRSVLAPSARELGAAGTSPLSDQTIAHPQWLLSSLLFWDRMGSLPDPSSAAAVLRRTQRARLDSTTTSPSGPVAQTIARAIAALEDDNVQRASSNFRQAIAADRTGAENAFLALYARRAGPLQVNRVAQSCQVAAPGDVGDDTVRVADLERADLEEVLTSSAPQGLQPGLRRRFQQCLLREHVLAKRYDRAAMLFDRMVAEQGDTPWEPEDAYRVAYWMLTTPTIGTEARRLESAQKLMLQAMAGSGEPTLDNISVAAELAWMCAPSAAARPCHAMLDSIIGRDSSAFYLPFSVGHQMAREAIGRAEARHALELLNRASERIASVPAHRPWYEAQIRLARARAYLTLVGHGEPASADSAISDLRTLLDELPSLDYDHPTPFEVYSTLADVYVAVGKIDSAEAALAEDPQVAQDSTMRNTRYFLLMARGQLDSARGLADAMLAEDETDASSLFLASVSRILAKDSSAVETAARFLEETEHEYRDYVRMLLYWSLRSRGQHDSATAIIDERWRNIDSSTWTRRIAHGDRAVWREMLIGLYAGKVERERIADPLKDERSYRGSAQAELGFPLNAARCETYFYDALLQGVSGLSWTRHKRQAAALDRAIATRYYSYYEYHMARILRGQLSQESRFKLSGIGLR